MKIFTNEIMQGAISDVLITGFIDSENPSVFHPLYERIYFILSNFIFELYIDGDGTVHSNTLNKIEKWFEIDEDDKFALMSIYSQIFKTEQEIKVTTVDYQATPFSTITIHYEDGNNKRQSLIDPNNFFGFTFL